MSEQVLVSVRVTSDIASRLEKLAQSMDRSKSYLAAEAIEDYLDIREWQIQAIHEGIKAADQEELVPFENVKKRWERKLENSSR
jgi:RHH-type rel operon transcriptional repressor/antitoxin RelB